MRIVAYIYIYISFVPFGRGGGGVRSAIAILKKVCQLIRDRVLLIIIAGQK